MEEQKFLKPRHSKYIGENSKRDTFTLRKDLNKISKLNDMNTEKLTNYLHSLIPRGIPSVDCAVYKDHECIYRYMTGYTDLDHTVEVSNDTQYLMFSMTKVLKLQDLRNLKTMILTSVSMQVQLLKTESLLQMVAVFSELQPLAMIFYLQEPMHIRQQNGLTLIISICVMT